MLGQIITFKLEIDEPFKGSRIPFLANSSRWVVPSFGLSVAETVEALFRLFFRPVAVFR